WTWSRISVPPGPVWTMPRTPVLGSRAETKLSGSVSSVTFAVCGKTLETIPTRPTPLTTGESSRTPSADPASIASECANGPPGGDLERAQDGGADTLHVVERSGRRRAERDRDQGQGDDDEPDDDRSANERAASPRRVRRGLRALNRRGEHRRARAATGWSHRNRLPRPAAGRADRLAPTPSSGGGRCGSGPCCCGGWPRTPRGSGPSPPRRT